VILLSDVIPRLVDTIKAVWKNRTNTKVPRGGKDEKIHN